MHTPDEIVTALRQGIEAGKLDSTPGNVFRSAWPAAKEHGYHGLLHDIFTTGYLSELPAGGVLVDGEGKVKAEPTCELCGETYSPDRDCMAGDHSYTARSRKDYGPNNTTNTGVDGLLPALS